MKTGFKLSEEVYERIIVVKLHLMVPIRELRSKTLSEVILLAV